MGHLGTLDPMAEGVLPVALGNATRLIEYIPDAEKQYRASMTLGGISDTQDAWGTIVETGQTSYREEELADILKEFTGVIQQIPPMYSAVHHQGTRLYELARQGIEVERQSRTIEIISLQLLGISRNETDKPVIELEVECSKGTYIRTLCHDIGQRLGTGAYMSKLVRTRAGIFSIEDAYTLEEIEQNMPDLEALVKPLDYPIADLPSLELLNREDIIRVFNGNRLKAETDINEGLVRVYTAVMPDRDEISPPAAQPGSLIAIAKISGTGNNRYMQPIKVFK